MWVQSLVRKLRSCKLHGVAKKKKKNTDVGAPEGSELTNQWWGLGFSRFGSPPGESDMHLWMRTLFHRGAKSPIRVIILNSSLGIEMLMY